MLDMDKLPGWIDEFKILPDWLIAFDEVCPPEWMLKDFHLPGTCGPEGFTKD